MIKICDIDKSAKDKLPPAFPDKSGIGVHYIDAFIKPINVILEDGTSISCKRKGLKIILGVGNKNGEGLMRKLTVSHNPIVMLDAALKEAAKAADLELNIDENEIYISL